MTSTKDETRAKEQLLKELDQLRRRVAELEKADAEHMRSTVALTRIIEGIPDAVVIMDINGIIHQVNSEFERGLGWKREDVIGRPGAGFISEADARKIDKEVMPELMKEGIVRNFDMVTLRKDGTSFPVLMSWALMKDTEGRPVNIISIAKDITRQKQIEKELKVSQEYTRNLIKSSLDMIVSTDRDRKIVEFNDSAEKTFSYSRSEVIGKHVDILYSDPSEGLRITEALRKTGKFAGQVANKRKNGEIFFSQLAASVLRSEDGKIMGTVGNSRDITEGKLTEDALQNRNKELSAINAVAQAICQCMKLSEVLDKALGSVLEIMGLQVGIVRLLSANAEDISSKVYKGISKETVQILCSEPDPADIPFWKRVVSHDRVLVTDNLSESTEANYRYIVEREKLQSAAGIPLKSKDRTLGVMVIASNDRRIFSKEEIQLLETIGAQIGIAVENAQLFDEITARSLTDELTGLYNRRHFYEMLESEMYRVQRYDSSFSVVMLDLDGFKEYNDMLGHINGDAALKSIAQMLKSSLRKSDMVFRYGGDEFAIILPQMDAEKARKIVDRIRIKWLQISEVEHPVLKTPLGFSAGISQFPEDAKTVDGLVFLADRALYQSKRQGRYKSTLACELLDVSMDARKTAKPD